MFVSLSVCGILISIMQPDKRRFVLYWLSFWAVLAPLVTLLVNPRSSDALQAFWNPTIWGTMVTVAFLLALVLCRYRPHIKAFYNDGIVGRFISAAGIGTVAMNGLELGIRKSDPYLKVAATIMLLVALLFAAKGIEEIIKRTRAWQKRRHTA